MSFSEHIHGIDTCLDGTERGRRSDAPRASRQGDRDLLLLVGGLEPHDGRHDGRPDSRPARCSISSFNVMKKTEKSSPTSVQCLLHRPALHDGHGHHAQGGRRRPASKRRSSSTTSRDVMVESVQWSGSSGGDDTPTESVSFAFAKVEDQLQQQDSTGGTVGNAVNGQLGPDDGRQVDVNRPSRSVAGGSGRLDADRATQPGRVDRPGSRVAGTTAGRRPGEARVVAGRRALILVSGGRGRT